MNKKIRILFDGPPGPESGMFIEDEDGHGISFGEWVQEGDLWYLEFPNLEAEIAVLRQENAGLNHLLDRVYEILSADE